MRIAALAAALALACVSVPADARPRQIVAHPDCNIVFPCEGVARSARGERIARAVGFGVAQNVYEVTSLPVRSRVAGLVSPLAAKAAEIVAACGSQIISAVRHTFIAGTRRISLHASGEAVDLQGNPSCIYAKLRGWPGGYSTDYRRVQHVHVSYSCGGREWGLRFAHGRHRHTRRR